MKKFLVILGILLLFGAACFATYQLFFRSENVPSHVLLGGKLLGPFNVTQTKDLDPAGILSWTNKYRADYGLPALSSNDLLVEASTRKVQEMFQEQYFDHVSPSGVTPAELVLSVGYNYKYTGENLAMGDFADEKALVDAWMLSPGHRENLLNKNYTEIGIATGKNEILNHNTWLAVQEFASPAPNCSAPSTALQAEITQEKTDLANLESQYQELSSQYNATLKKTDEARTIYAELKSLEDEMNKLSAEINNEVTQYNLEVSTYNKCIES